MIEFLSGPSNKVEGLKREAAACREAFYNTLKDYDCGIELLKEVNPRAARMAARYNAAMEQLRDLDPGNFPASYKPI